MVIPIGDDDSDRVSPPIVNFVLIGINVVVFVFLQWFGTNNDFTYAFSVVPAEIVTGQDQVTEQPVVDPRTGEPVTNPATGQPEMQPGLRPTPISVYITLLTSMFMHGGIGHILGNMLFLWIFGDNVEDALGHARYAIFYLVCGVLASLAHVAATYAFGGNPLVPSLGASGAISGVLGAYLLLFPHKKVTLLVGRAVTRVPAWIAVGLWFLFQLISALGALGGGSQLGGIAYGAHIGGFIAGLALVYPFLLGRNVQRSAV
jgi:membrane associated rhomboid family serine protease